MPLKFAMDGKRIIIIVLLLLFLPSFGKAQLIGFRLAANSGLLLTEFGSSDVPHPEALAKSPAQSSDIFTPQPSIGIEGEVLFQISKRSFFGVEVDFSQLRGFNDNPPYYNYYLTSYFDAFQDEYYQSSIKYNSTLINMAVNYKYFFFPESAFQPFVKLTGVVAFIGTDLSYKDLPEVNLDSDILYARGTSNTEQDKWPAFHAGIGLGFSYDISDHLAFQVDGTSTVINSGIVNGVPNFTYNMDENLLNYNPRLSLTMQVSVGVAYTIEVETGSRGGTGKTDPNLPFYRKNR